MTDDDRLPWFPCYPTKLLGALAGMKPTEGYVYVIILLRIYESGGPCRDSLDALATRTHYNKRVVSEALDALFKAGRLRRETDGIHNPIAAGILADRKAFRAERVQAGRKGAERRWEKDKGKQTNGYGKAIRQPMAKDGDLHLDLEGDLEEKKDSFPLRGKARKQATRLSSDWWPSEANIQYALAKGLTLERINIEAEKFRNYWTAKAGKDAAKLDWDATWQNWIIKAATEAPNGKARQQHQQTLAERGRDLAERARDLERAAGIGRADDPFRGA